MNRILACLLIFTLVYPRLWADSGPDQNHTDTIRKKAAECVEKQRRVAVEMFDGRRLQGAISEAGQDTFVVSFGSRSTTLVYTDVKKIEWQSPISSRVEVGIISAAIVSSLILIVYLVNRRNG
jgi:hypothetical protein